MGNTAKAILHFEGRKYSGEALLETEEVIFRGERRLAVPFAKIRSVDAEGGRLTLNGEVVLELRDAFRGEVRDSDGIAAAAIRFTRPLLRSPQRQGIFLLPPNERP